MTNINVHRVKRITVGNIEHGDHGGMWRIIRIEHNGAAHNRPGDPLEVLEIVSYIADGDDDVEIVIEE